MLCRLHIYFHVYGADMEFICSSNFKNLSDLAGLLNNITLVIFFRKVTLPTQVNIVEQG